MSKLDVNTNGSWRTVVGDCFDSPALRDACRVISEAALARGSKHCPTWRLRDAEGTVYAHCDKTGLSTREQPDAQWRTPAFGSQQP